MGTDSSPASPSPSEFIADEPSDIPPRSPSETCDEFTFSTPPRSLSEPCDDFTSSTPPRSLSEPCPDFTPSTPAGKTNPSHDIPSVGLSPFVNKQQSEVVQDKLVNLDASRSAVFRAVGPSIPEASFTFFKDSVLPPLDKDIDIARVVKALKTTGDITEDGRWRGFPHDPKDEKPTDDTEESREKLEDIVFGRFVSIVSAIVAHSGLERAPTLEYSSKPTLTPISVYDGKGGKPDGYLVFRSRIEDGNRLFWRDICTPAEFKLRHTNNSIRNNNKKICWSMQQIMHEDPRRRFVTAFTIQDTTMRIWFANRSEMIVSKPFNFIEDKSKFIHFFLSQAFAPEDQLGLDPTMKVVKIEPTGRLVYDVTIRESETKEHIYRTRELINDDATASLHGRGTRVWQMVQVVNGVENAKVGGVLKDYWIDEDRAREGDILEELGQLYADHKDEAVFLDSFLTVVAHGDVHVGGKVDNTRQLMTRGAAPGGDKPEDRFTLSPTSQRLIRPSGKTLSVQTGSHPRDLPKDARPVITAPAQRKPVTYWNKTHYRVLFLQVCKGPLSKETSLAAIFAHLESVVFSVQLMHSAGTPWVHRDVSAGNILIDSEGNPRLADLEYSKRLGDDKSHHVRTGTAKYMATEVDHECYEYLNEEYSDESESEAPIISARERRLMKKAGKRLKETLVQVAPEPTTTDHPFRYNTLHDLESVLWIAFDAVINRERKLASGPNSGSIALTEEEYKVAIQLFYDFSDRTTAMKSSTGIINRTLRNLPGPLAPIGKSLLILKKNLVKRFMAIERDPASIGANACGKLYDKFSQQFGLIRSTLEDAGDIIVSPIVFALEVSDQKQGRLTSTAARNSKNKRPGEGNLSQGSKKQKIT